MSRPDRNGFIAVISIIIIGAVLAPLLISEFAWPEKARNILSAEGNRETGAENLVSAIYLGYRAYDTVGETIVLLVALAGSIALITKAASAAEAGGQAVRPRDRATPTTLSSAAPNSAAPRARRSHTEIIDTVASKLAPIVLLFGLYVMAFGHQSPGGGFQGGVVLASGIVFIALGRREGGFGAIDPRRKFFAVSTLTAAEAVCFALLLGLVFVGAFGEGFTANPLPADGVVPPVAYIIAMNAAIGFKVASGVALLCVFMLGDMAK